VLPELGVAVFAVITVYYSLLGAFILVKTKVVSLKAASVIVGYSIALWVSSVIMYVNYPYLPTIYLVNGIIGGIQDVLIWIFILVKTRIMSLKMAPFTGVLAISLLIRLIAFLCSNLPIPQIFIVNVALGTTANILIWTYVLIKNGVIGSNTVSIILCYSIALWICSVIMVWLGLPYFPIVYIVNTIMPYPFTILVFYCIDRYRLGRRSKC